MSQQINLFNPIFLKEKKYFSALAMLQALGLIMVGILLLFAYSTYQSRSLNQDAVNAAAQLASAQKQLAKMNAEYGARKKNQSLEDELKKAQQEQAALQEALARLQNEEFGNRKGHSPYLRAFSRQIIDGVWLTGFSIDGGGNAIGIQGRAIQAELIPAYINRLKQESVIQGKSFATLEIQQAAERKIQEGSAGVVEIKKMDAPSFIEFDLRSAGVEKTVAKPVDVAAGDIGAKPRIDAPAPKALAGAKE